MQTGKKTWLNITHDVSDYWIPSDEYEDKIDDKQNDWIPEDEEKEEK